MARTRQKKRTGITIQQQPKEMDKVVEEEVTETQPLTPKPVQSVTVENERKTLDSRSDCNSPEAYHSTTIPDSPEVLDETQPEINYPRISDQGLSRIDSSPCKLSIHDQLEPSSSRVEESAEKSRHMSPYETRCSTIYVTSNNALSPLVYGTEGKLNMSKSQLVPEASTSFSKADLLNKSSSHLCNQTAHSELTLRPIYFFIEASDREKSGMMEKAYSCLIDRDYLAEWISEKDISGIDDFSEIANRNFVLERFEGEIFDYLNSNMKNGSHPKWRIYSPMSIIHFFSESLPEREYPIMDVCMRHCFVTVSGLPREDRKILEDKMRAMSAVVSSSLKDRSTHIVATSWTTEKTMYARAHGHPLVMSPAWVDYCWEQCQQEESIDAYQLSFDRNFRLPVFAGFVICGANLTRHGSGRLCEVVTQNGGIYEDELDFYRTTHLVVIKKEGSKYEKAMENDRIKVVSIDWIHNSVAKGYPLPEEDAMMKKVVNKMVMKMINLLGLGSNPLAEVFNVINSSCGADSRNSMILIPGSPEFKELDDVCDSDEDCDE